MSAYLIFGEKLLLRDKKQTNFIHPLKIYDYEKERTDKCKESFQFDYCR